MKKTQTAKQKATLRTRPESDKARATKYRRPRPAVLNQGVWRMGFASAAVSGLMTFGWTNTFEFAVAGGVCLIVCVASTLLPRRRGIQGRLPGRLPGSAAGAFVRGAAVGLVAVGIAALVVPVARGLPSYDAFLDRDRTSVEQRVQTLVEAKNFALAAQLVRKRLEKKLSRSWKHDLHRQHVDLLTRAGKETTDAKEAEQLWESAIAFGAKYGLDTEVAVTALASLRDSEAKAAALLDAQERNHEQLAAWITSLRDKNDFAALDALLKIQIESVPRGAWQEDLNATVIDNLIAWGDSLGDLESRAAKYSEALDRARAGGLDERLIKSRLDGIDTLRRMQPSSLPQGTTARVLGIRTIGERPDVLVELAVETSDSAFLHGLRSKDFSVWSGDRRLQEVDVMEVELNDTRPINVVVLLDHSKSTAEFREQIHEAALTLAAESPLGVVFRMMTFADGIQSVGGWTRDLDVIRNGFRQSKTGVKTALREAILGAVRELQSRPGLRILIVFTDGADTTGRGLQDVELGQVCRGYGVRFFAVGLATASLDDSLLSHLAQETNGRYELASVSSELVERFKRLRTVLTRPTYWVRLYDASKVKWPLEIRVGTNSRVTIAARPTPENEG